MTRLGWVVVLVIGSLLAFPQWRSKAGQEEKPQTGVKGETAIGSRTIKITGNGILQTEPDASVVEFSVVTSVNSVAGARALSAEAVASVVQALQTLKIPRMVITTRAIELNILRAESVQGQSEPPKVTGYQLVHTLDVGIEDQDIEQLAKHTALIIDTALGKGANALNGINYFKKDILSLRRAVLKKAVDDAIENAQLLAKCAGVEKVEIIEIVSVGNGGDSDVRYNMLASAAKSVGEDAALIRPAMKNYAEEVEVTFRF